jgi:chemotaxis protein MotB
MMRITALALWPTRHALPKVAQAFLAFALGACVPQAKYDALVQQTTAAAAAAKTDADARAQNDAAEIARLKTALTAAEQASTDRDATIAELRTGQHNTQAQLDEATAINQQLRGELERLGKDVDKILSDKGRLAKEIEDAKARLVELRHAQAAAVARTELFRDFQKKLTRMIEGHQLAIGVRNGFLVMTLSSDLLFDAGKAEIKKAGQGALMEIAHAFASATGRRFQVAVHTDNVVTKSKRFPSNWELSAVRAVEIVRYMISQGTTPQLLTAAGGGDVDPIASNESADGKTKNRRIEFVLMPNAEDLVVPVDYKP